MKRKAIYLDANNDIYSTLGKLERLDTNDIILVIPKSSVLFHSVVNFKIIRSELQRQHKNLAIVTVDVKGQQLAQRAGIPVYRDLDLNEETTEVVASATALPTEPVAPRSPTEVKIKYKRKVPLSRPLRRPVPAIVAEENVSHPPLKLTLFRPLRLFSNWHPPRDWGHKGMLAGWLAGSLVVLGLVVYLVAPRATVLLEVRSEPFTHQFDLVLADQTDREAAGQNVFKGRFVMVEKKLTQTFSATGIGNRGNPGSGTITVYNYTRAAKPLGLRAQTRFVTVEGMVFRSQSEVLISSASQSGSQLVPGRAQIKVEAEVGGSVGNLPAETKLTIPGLGATGIDLVYGKNDDPFVGGTDEEVKLVTEEDLQSAKESISKNVFIDAEAELETTAGKKEDLIPDLVQNDIINIVPSVPAGTTKETFDLDIHVRSWTLLPPKGQLDDIMQNTVEIVVPNNRELTPQTLKGVRLVLDNADFITHIIDFTVMVDGAITPKISAVDLSESLANRSLKNVENLFNSIPDIISYKITLWPFWVKKLPLLESNIKIMFSYINQ
ncbi:MAG: baseplate J/gp47 family protein [Patescibacteria group bacterium]